MTNYNKSIFLIALLSVSLLMIMVSAGVEGIASARNVKKRLILIGYSFLASFIMLIFLSGCNSYPDASETSGTGSSFDSYLPNRTLRVLCTEDQFHLTRQLTKEFQKIHTEVLIEISLYERKAPIEKLSLGRNDIILVSDAQDLKIPEQYWRMRYARDGMVGIINKSNPYCKEILEFGMGTRQFAQILSGKKLTSWSELSKSQLNSPIKVFINSDELCRDKLWTYFLMIDPKDFDGVITASVQDMIDSIKSDPLSIGFCCHRYAYDPLTRKEIAEIKVVPLDCNSNGIVEDNEMFYDDLDLLQRAMWLGKYPCHSFQNHYIVAKENPKNKIHINFMKWILTEGQKELHNEGFILLRTRFIDTEIEELNRL